MNGKGFIHRTINEMECGKRKWLLVPIIDSLKSIHDHKIICKNMNEWTSWENQIFYVVILYEILLSFLIANFYEFFTKFYQFSTRFSLLTYNIVPTILRRSFYSYFRRAGFLIR